jgi:uncharacterized repeat protein (TIGR03803 family)
VTIAENWGIVRAKILESFLLRDPAVYPGESNSIVEVMKFRAHTFARESRETRMKSQMILLSTTLIMLLGFASLSAQAQTYNILYTFTGQADGGQPVGGLIRDAEGNLYGTTCCGGTHGAGNVFMLDKAGKEKVLYSFTGGQDGDQPYASLIRDAEGNLYGTTFFGGGSAECTGGCGVVFKLDTSGKATVLHAFTRTGGDGANPYDGLVQDPKGNLYGTTVNGGSSSAAACFGGCGVVFRINTAGKETVLYRFRGGTDGANPFAGLVRDAKGNLYGTTQYGGTSGYGTVFKLDNARKETVLYTFTGGADGGQPLLGYLVRDAKGNLYGTTVRGGASSCSYLCGTVFELEKSGKETVLHGFVGGTDGTNPYAGLARDAEGNLYGTTNQGGASGYGTVFKLDKSGQETLLHTFTGTGGDGASPYDDLILDPKSNLYGTAADGGDSGCYDDLGCGIVFRLSH